MRGLLRSTWVLPAAFAVALGSACAGPPETPPQTPAQKLNAEGVRRLDRGELEGAEAIFRDALREAELVDDLDAQAETWSNLGAAAMARGKWVEARGYYLAAIRLLGISGSHTKVEVTTRTNLGSVLLMVGRASDALKQYEFAVQLAERQGDEKTVRLARSGVAASHLRLGDGEKAAHIAQQVSADAERAGDQAAQSAALVVEAGAAELAGSLPKARVALEKALVIDRELGNPSSVLSDLRALARVAKRAGDLREAAIFLGRSARVARNLGLLEEAERDLRDGLELGSDTLEHEQLEGMNIELEAVVVARKLKHRKTQNDDPSNPVLNHAPRD